jgi:hypothetical protein
MKNSSKDLDHENLKKTGLWICNLIVAGDTVINSMYIYNHLSTDGTDLSDIIATLIFGIIWFSVVRYLTTIGIKGLPNHSSKKLKTTFPAWFGFMACVTLVSIWLTLSYLGLSTAQTEYLNKNTQKTNEIASLTIKAQRQAEGLEAPLLSADNTAEDLLVNEQSSGAVCSVGKGRGECANIISGLHTVAVSTRNQIVQSKASAAPHIRRIEEYQDQLRRLANDKDMTFKERVEKMKQAMALLIEEIETLKRIIPIPALQNVIEAFSREFKTAGIGDIGANRLNSKFRPIADQLRREIGNLKEASNRQIKPISNLSNYEIISKGINAIVPLLAIAIVLGASPMFFCLYLLVSGWEDDPETPPYDPTVNTVYPALEDNLIDINAGRSLS